LRGLELFVFWYIQYVFILFELIAYHYFKAWVLTHLEYYKPDEERIRRAFLETELRSLHSPYARMKAMQERVGA